MGQISKEGRQLTKDSEPHPREYEGRDRLHVPVAIILLLRFLSIKGQCLALINLSHFEVEDGHRVHFHVIETDFGIGAAVSLGEEKPEAHSTRLRKPVLMSVTPRPLWPECFQQQNLNVHLLSKLNCYFIISENLK